jgi:hypothetical protein
LHAARVYHAPHPTGATIACRGLMWRVCAVNVARVCAHTRHIQPPHPWVGVGVGVTLLIRSCPKPVNPKAVTRLQAGTASRSRVNVRTERDFFF